MAIAIDVVQASTGAGIDAAFATLVRNKADALIVPQTRSSSAGASSLLSWRRVMRCPLSIMCGSLRKSAA
jgi:hypothetical protein